MGDARVEFYAGDKLLGRPVAGRDRRAFRLKLGDARIGAAPDLKALAGGRRLDAAGARRAPDARRAAEAAPPSTLPPANPVDPGVAGKYRTVSGEYALKSVRLPGFPAPVEMRAEVVSPVGAPGRRPSRCSCTAVTTPATTPRATRACPGPARRARSRCRATGAICATRSSWPRRDTSRCPSRPTGSTGRTTTPRTVAPRRVRPWCGCTSPAGPSGPPIGPERPRPCAPPRPPTWTGCCSSATPGAAKASTGPRSTACPGLPRTRTATAVRCAGTFAAPS